MSEKWDNVPTSKHSISHAPVECSPAPCEPRSCNSTNDATPSWPRTLASCSLTAADRWLVPVPALHHHHFTSLGAVSIEYPSVRRAIAATAATAQAYTSVARASLEFLDAFVKKDSTALSNFRRGAAWPHLRPAEKIAHESD
jgi:hypothetical protein